MNKISVIVPTYNSKKYLARCIESILKQTYKNIEILIIDDGSTDGTDDFMKETYKNYDNIKYIKQNNSGVSVARNRGIKNAMGKYIFFVDADDTIDKNVLTNLVDNFDENYLIGVQHCIYKKSQKICNEYKYNIYDVDQYLKNVFLGNTLGVIWGYLFDAKVVKEICFDTNTYYMEDTIFLINYLKQTKLETIRFIYNDSYYNYFINNESITNSSRNIIKKCYSINYSFSIIKELTDGRYDELINNDLIEILEKEMRLCKTKDERKEIINNINIENYNGDIKRIKIFSILYKNKNYTVIEFYYRLRKIIKKLKNQLNNNYSSN